MARHLTFSHSESSYVLRADEITTTLVLSGGNGRSAQAKIDDVKLRQGFDILLIKVRGVIEIREEPLIIYSRMLLMFEGKNACIKAHPQITAPCLLEIKNSESLAITGSPVSCHFDGGENKDLMGIYIVNSTAMHIDQVRVEGCAKGGIVVEIADRLSSESGNVDLIDAFDRACSVTRCYLSSNGVGLSINSAVPFVVTNNNILKSRTLGITIQCPTGLVVGNQLEENTCDIFINFKHNGLVMQNLFCSSVINGSIVNMSPSCKYTLFLENMFLYDFVSSMELCGEGHVFIENKQAKNLTRTEFGPINVSISSEDALDIDSLVAGFQQSTTLFPFQIDIYVHGCPDEKHPSEASEISKAIEAGRIEFGEHVILVLRVDGHFLVSDAEGLLVPANTCILLDGTIKADLNSFTPESPGSQLVLLSQVGHTSFIGGLLNCREVVNHGVNAVGPLLPRYKQQEEGTKAKLGNSKTDAVVLHGVTIVRAKTDGIYTKGRCPKLPFFIHKCNIEKSGRRGIWVHVCSNTFVLRNSSSGNVKDGIDFDAGCKNSFAIENLCFQNNRHGVFVEEGASHNVVVANMCTENDNSGLHVWNEAVKGVTKKNIAAFNICNQNTKGISIGGRGEEMTVSNNCFFNNACINNNREGMVTGNKFSSSNSFYQTIVKDNCKKARGENQINHWGPLSSIQFCTPKSLDTKRVVPDHVRQALKVDKAKYLSSDSNDPSIANSPMIIIEEAENT